jgi:NAD(P)-dependent dehydrogenase (short-subunit alcohol dehydrogenase family)
MEPTKPLHEKVAVVTGAGNGIGRAVAKALAAAGASVVVADVAGDDCARTVQEISDAGGTALPSVADVSSTEQTEQMVATAVEQLGRLDILVNNAGIGGPMARLHELEPDDFDRVLDVNLGGVFRGCRAALPHFLAQGDGRIVNMASTYGLIGAPLAAPYCASKGAIINLTRQLAVDYGPDGIRVNAICPGYIDTQLGRRRLRLDDAAFAAATEIRERAAGRQPLGRQGDPGEVAEVAVFLASDASSFMTGSIVTVDGGCVTTFNYGDASN